MIGRPTKLTADISDALLAGIRAGLPQKTAAALVGVSESCLCSWIRRGKRGEEHFAEFVQHLMRSRAEAVQRAVAAITRASETDWRAAAWWLERRHPDEFGSDRKRIRELAAQLAALTEQLNGAIERRRQTRGE